MNAVLANSTRSCRKRQTKVDEGNCIDSVTQRAERSALILPSSSAHSHCDGFICNIPVPCRRIWLLDDMYISDARARSRLNCRSTPPSLVAIAFGAMNTMPS